MPRVRDLAQRLTSLGLRPEIFTAVENVVSATAQSLAQGSLRAVVAAGGDGTARLIADRTPPGTPLTILPLGTENLLARYLELTTDTSALARRIAQGLSVQLDAGEANGSLFTLMVGCGFDADVVRRLHRSRRGHIHHLSYVKPIVDAIRNYDYPLLRVHYRRAPQPTGPASGVGSPGPPTGDSQAEVLTARWAFVVNLPRYAGGLNFAPGASGVDGMLDICTFKEGSLWNGLLYLGGVLLGQHEAMEGFRRVRSPELRIEAQAAVPYQIDGDPGGELPLTIRVLPKRLSLLVTRRWVERNQSEIQERVTT